MAAGAGHARRGQDGLGPVRSAGGGDSGYGDATAFRLGLAQRGLSYVVAIKPSTSACAGLTLYADLRELQTLLAVWTGACPTCRQPLPTSWQQPYHQQRLQT